MIEVKNINLKDIQICFELDSDSISLWSKKQWESEINKDGVEVFGLFLSNEIIGIYVFQIVIDEAQINYFSVKKKFRRQGFGSYLMSHLINTCETLNIKKLLLEVSEHNQVAEKFYTYFDFLTVGIRKNYYKDGSNALLKEKNLIKEK